METPVNSNLSDLDELLLNKFEKVSLADTKRTEWWILRKVQEQKHYHKETAEIDKIEIRSYINPGNYKSRYSDVEDSLSLKSHSDTSFNKFGKRLSDVNASKFSNKRLSVENELRGEKSGYESNKCLYNKTKSNEEPVFKTKKDSTYMEDELYVNGHTVTWSRGLVNNHDDLDNGRKIICSYTSDFLVKQALWCTFYCECPVFDDTIIDFANSDEPSGNPVEAVCITDSHTIRVFTPKGEDYTVSVPFVLNKLWNTKFGIFITKEIGSK